MASQDGRTTGLRLLLVEDDALFGEAIAAMLVDDGMIVVGPISAMEVGAAIADSEPVDAAILDVRLLDGDTSFPVAAILAQRGVPFGFVSGHGRDALPLAFLDRPLIGKPVLRAALLAFVEEMVRTAPHPLLHR